MKLITFLDQDTKPCFGFLAQEEIYSFQSLEQKLGIETPRLISLVYYLENIEEGLAQARLIHDSLMNMPESDRQALKANTAVLLPVLKRPAALLDFGVSPRHLLNSGRTLINHEFSWPLSQLIGLLASRLIKKSTAGTLHYYKGNHNEISGNGDVIPWPAFTSYLDVEPELAFVTGNNQVGKPVIAGYLIFNDLSARDVQFPEMKALGPTRSKDFTLSNGLGPTLVTPDEIENVLNLSVSVDIGGRMHWKGSTAEYSVRPEDIMLSLENVFALRPGTVIGMGTIPDCCGLDNDLWLRPGDKIYIEFEKIGKLEQTIGIPGKFELSRWGYRSDLDQ